MTQFSQTPVGGTTGQDLNLKQASLKQNPLQTAVTGGSHAAQREKCPAFTHPAHPRLESQSPRGSVSGGVPCPAKAPLGGAQTPFPPASPLPHTERPKDPTQKNAILAWGTVPSSSPGKPRVGASNTENTAPSVSPRGSRATGRGAHVGEGAWQGGIPVVPLFNSADERPDVIYS